MVVLDSSARIIRARGGIKERRNGLWMRTARSKENLLVNCFSVMAANESSLL